MMQLWTVAVVLLALGCDKRKEEVPTPPAKELTCQTQAECVLRSSDACDACSECAAFHASAPAETCTGAQAQATCTTAPCSNVVAECVKGACITRPK